MPPTLTSMSSSFLSTMSGLDMDRDRKRFKLEEDDENDSLDRRSSGSFEGSSEGSPVVTPDRIGGTQQKDSEFESPHFISGQLSVQLNGQLSRNQPEDLSTACKKPHDGSQKYSPQRTPSP